MAKPKPPAAAAAEAQADGSDPARSVFVSASAGSGKTKVLGDRVLRLMLEGRVPPRRILCLTFTKAAAAEMSSRIAHTLALWAAKPENDLRRDIAALTGSIEIDETLIADARRLFARVLDTPGGMRIHTIHAFCQSLLRRFPLEAAIAPHFQLIEERDANEMMEEARQAMLAAAHAGNNPELALALAKVADRMHEGRIGDLLRELLAQRRRINELQRGMGGIEAIVAAISRTLGLKADEDRVAFLNRACQDRAFAKSDLARAAQAMAASTATDKDNGRIIAQWIESEPSARASMIEEYVGVFLTDKREIRKNLAGKSAVAAMASIVEVLGAEASRLRSLLERLNTIENLEATHAILRLGIDVVGRYEAMKSRQARLDYDDLIHVARELLGQPGIAPWVLYKLDGGIDHVLIDEAQDTSSDQWQLVVSLTAEYFAGLGAVEARRTLFAVGDPKQSIFSFQGAAPAEFRRHIEYFRALDPSYFDEVSLNVSFRSSNAVLQIVDKVFAGPAGNGVKQGEVPIDHLCSRPNDFGEVRLWPLAVPIELPPPEPWAIPEIVDQMTSPAARLAERVASEIVNLAGRGITRQKEGVRFLAPGDFLVLVRNRGVFVDLLVRALKDRGVPVAGADRMHLLDQIAVMDLLAFARFLLLPDDDLSLAEVLRSPLVGLSEEQLFELCWDRPGRLWPRLREMTGTSDWARAACDFLHGYIVKAGRMTPHELYADLLGWGRARHRLYQRLGPQCGEAIDEFLGLAMVHEKSHAPTLQGFLAWVTGGEMVVKRDLESAAGQVRIMTVHGAKGLQAPVVFLCDQRRSQKPPSGLFWIDSQDRQFPLWSSNSRRDGNMAASLRQKTKMREMEEENRLLYVAMTRAEERLIICGWAGGRATNEKSWHDHVGDVLRGMQSSEQAVTPVEFAAGAGWKGEALCFSSGQTEDISAQTLDKAEPVELGDWLRQSAPSSAEGIRAMAPSRLGMAEAATLSPLGLDDGWRFKRGKLIHHLLELLPGLEGNMRREAGRAYLSQPAHGLEPSMAQDILDETLAVIDNPAFERIFGVSAMAEVPIAASWSDALGRQSALCGRIDRLWIGDGEVWAVDFKSNRPAPLRLEHVLPEYRMQMAAYRHALKKIYPNKDIRCFLLWSDGPRLMELSPDMLELHDSSPEF